MNRPPHAAGQSVVETLIALGLLVTGIGAASILVFGGQGILTDRGNTLEARALTREGIEAAKVILKSDWAGVGDGTYGITFSNGTWQLSGGQDTQSVFTRRVTVTTTATDQRTVKSRVEWSASPSRTLSVELVSLVTNWEAVQGSGGDGGGGGLTGDWTDPRTLGSVDLGPGNSATDLDVKNKIVYLSAEASAASKPDFFIVDATDGENPVVRSSLNVGSKGLNGVDVAGTYAYAANQSDTAQLLVIDVSDLNNPTTTASFALPGITESDTHGKSIFYYDSKVYITTNEDSGGKEFHIVDVSNPSSPASLGSYEVGDNVNDVFVSGNRAYLATDLGNAGLIILDVSNPASLSLLGQSYSSDVKSVMSYSSSLTFLGPGQDFSIASTTDPSSITNVGSLSVGDTVNDIAARDYLAFIGTSNSNREFQVINVTTSTNPTLHSYFNFPQVATGIDYEDNLVYVAVRSNDALRIITSSP